MKILLINPPVLEKTIYGKLYRTTGHTVPQGLAYLAASVEQAGFHVNVLDCIAHKYTDKDLAYYLKNNHYDIVGISTLTPFASRSFEAARITKMIQPHSKVVLGGPHVTIFPERSLKECPSADFIVCGEGEHTFVDLVKAFANGCDFGNVKGLAYRVNTIFKRTEQRPVIADLDSLPFPAYHLFPMELYCPMLMKYRKLPTFAVVVTRGCPFHCIFCCNVIHGNQVRLRNVNKVMEELLILKDQYNAKGIIFQDSSIAQNRKWLIELCDKIIESKINMEWACLARVDQVDYNLLKKMRKAGCWQISYGIESGNQKSLDFLRKGYKLKQIEYVTKITQKIGIQIRAAYMLGIPGEDKQDILNTINFAKKLNTMFASFSLTIPFPGTRLYDDVMAVRGESCGSTSWDNYNFFNVNNPVFIPNGINKEELCKIIKYAWRSYYLSPRLILRHLIRIRKIADIYRYYVGFKSLLLAGG